MTTDKARMTDDEVMEALLGDTPLNRARRVFSGEVGRMEQVSANRYEPTPVEWKRMEFEAVERIAAALGIPIEPEIIEANVETG